MNLWHVTIEVADDDTPPDPAALEQLLELLGPDGAVIGPAEEPVDGKVRYGIDVVLQSDNPVSDLGGVVSTFRAFAEKAGLPAWPIARLSVISDAELDAELAAPTFPELVGIREIAGLLNVSPQRASALCRSASFPVPIAELRAGPVWTAPSVRRFVEEWKRQPGRPRLNRTTA